MPANASAGLHGWSLPAWLQMATPLPLAVKAEEALSRPVRAGQDRASS
ncbi:hypothetical protein SNL152K_10848 [Streptomyces sp. NL15-2K]|nr:hypothetical protein SNL152K_10848 [Streptomyces sp. NL15-2K]